MRRGYTATRVCYGPGSLPAGWRGQRTLWRRRGQPWCRGLHSSTFQLNLSALYGIGSARRGCVARDKGVSWGV